MLVKRTNSDSVDKRRLREKLQAKPLSALDRGAVCGLLGLVTGIEIAMFRVRIARDAGETGTANGVIPVSLGGSE